MNQPKQFRQGDVLLVPCAGLPDDAKQIENGTVDGRVVLAYGEATGHHHSIALHGDRVALFHDTTGGYLVVSDGPPVALEHQEHTAITLPAGVYHLPQQVEYTPAELVRVQD